MPLFTVYTQQISVTWKVASIFCVRHLLILQVFTSRACIILVNQQAVSVPGQLDCGPDRVAVADLCNVPRGLCQPNRLNFVLPKQLPAINKCCHDRPALHTQIDLNAMPMTPQCSVLYKKYGMIRFHRGESHVLHRLSHITVLRRCTSKSSQA